ERFEVSLAETPRAATLDDFEEQRRPVLNRLGENLKQVAFVVPIDQDAQLGQFVDVLLDPASALRQQFVVGRRYLQERNIVPGHGAQAGDDVAGGQRDVLHTRSAVELEELVNLRSPPALCWLVDRKLDPAATVRHHLGHQRRILGGYVLVIEADQEREA